MMHFRRLRILILFTALFLASCRFEDRTPGGSKPEDVALRTLVAEFYQSVGARDLAHLGRVTTPSSTVLLARNDGAVLIPVRTMIEVPERRNEGGGVRIARIDLRPDGEVATARVVVVSVNATDQHEDESTDFLTIGHREGAWRVAQAVFGPWRIRSAP
jgi:hypothetical protein